MQNYSSQRIKLLAGIAKVDGAFLAGGSVNSVFTGRPIADYDFYFRSREAFAEAVRGAYDNCWWCLHASDRSVTFSDNGTALQFMHFEFFDDASKVFDAFDFTVCMAAFDMDADTFVFHDQFLTDCAERKLRFHAGTRFPLISALRVLKYQERGYAIGREDMLRLSLACAGLNLNSWEDLERQIGGLYGDRTVVARDGDFSVGAAIAAIEQGRCEIGAAPTPEREPYLADADALLAHLGFSSALEDA